MPPDARCDVCLSSGDSSVPKRKRSFTGWLLWRSGWSGQHFLALRCEGQRPAAKLVLIIKPTPAATLWWKRISRRSVVFVVAEVDTGTIPNYPAFRITPTYLNSSFNLLIRAHLLRDSKDLQDCWPFQGKSRELFPFTSTFSYPSFARMCLV